MNTEDIDVSIIIKNGWKQGACLQVNADSPLINEHPQTKEGWYILISQDCDIVNPILEKEPYVEFICTKSPAQYQTSLENNKNSRHLHLTTTTIDKKQVQLEFFPYQRIFLPRQLLTEKMAAPEFSIEDPRSLRILRKWLTNRYCRTALPGSFNDRIKAALNPIKKILETISSLGLYISLNPNTELAPEKPYILELNMIVHSGEDGDATHDAFNDIMQLLAKCKGIEIYIQESHVHTVKSINLEKYMRLTKWDFDAISFNKGANGETLETAD